MENAAQFVGPQAKKLHKSSILTQQCCTITKTEPEPTKRNRFVKFLITKIHKFENRTRPNKTRNVAQLDNSQIKKMHKSAVLCPKKLHKSRIRSQIKCTSSKTEPDPTKRNSLHKLWGPNRTNCTSRQRQASQQPVTTTTTADDREGGEREERGRRS